MIPIQTDSLRATLELDIGAFHFYPNMIISRMNEGVTVNFDNILPVFLKCLQHYTVSTPLVYISDRVNSYSFDPTLHIEAKDIFANLKGYGVVVYDDMNLRIAQLEQGFISWPLHIFRSLEDATTWANQLLHKN